MVFKPYKAPNPSNGGVGEKSILNQNDLPLPKRTGIEAAVDPSLSPLPGEI